MRLMGINHSCRVCFNSDVQPGFIINTIQAFSAAASNQAFGSALQHKPETDSPGLENRWMKHEAAHVLPIVLQNQDSHVLIFGLYLISTNRLTSVNPFLAGFLVSHTQDTLSTGEPQPHHTPQNTFTLIVSFCRCQQIKTKISYRTL